MRAGRWGKQDDARRERDARADAKATKGPRGARRRGGSRAGHGGQACECALGQVHGSVVGLRGELTGSRGRSALPGMCPDSPQGARGAQVVPPLRSIHRGERTRRRWRGSILALAADAKPEWPLRGRCPIISTRRANASVAFSRREDLRRNTFHPRAQLAARRRQRADARPARDADRRRAAREDQARVHAALRHGRLRRRHQRREDRRDRQQARGQEVLPPLGLPRRHQGAHAQRHARAPPRGGHPQGGQGDAPSQPPRAQAADEAQGLRGSRSPAHGPAADPHGAQVLMADDRTPPEEQPEETPAPSEEQAPAPVDERAGEESPAAEEAPVEAPRDEERPQGDPLAAAATDATPEAPATDAAPAAPATPVAEDVEEDYEDDEDETPRVKPEIPGADLEVDIVEEGADPLSRGEDDDEDATPGESDDISDQPIAAVTIDLAAGARYRATGKRKTAIARVILLPGTGAYTINGRTLDVFFPRPTLQRNIRQPLEAVGYADRMDVVARMQGGGVSSQAGALRHGISRALLEADPNLRGELKRRGFLTRDPRVKERKKAGLKKARKRPQFSKR